MNTERIPLDLIEMGDRLRAVDPDHVLMIMADAEIDGIRQAIEVRPAKAKGRYLLVSGAHRLTVARELGHADIPATLLPKMTDDEARLREINENVYRHELSELDRAVFLAEKKAIHERLFPHTKSGGDRKSDEWENQIPIFGNLIERFTVEAQEKLKLSRSQLYRIIKRAKIAKDVRDRIATTPIARNGSELDALVKLDEMQQRTAVNMVLSGNPDAPKKIAEAAALISGTRAKPVRPDDDIQLAVLMRAWKDAGARARRRFIDELVSQDDPHVTGALDSLTPTTKAA